MLSSRYSVEPFRLWVKRLCLDVVGLPHLDAVLLNDDVLVEEVGELLIRSLNGLNLV
jgi:hypothetical protein